MLSERGLEPHQSHPVKLTKGAKLQHISSSPVHTPSCKQVGLKGAHPFPLAAQAIAFLFQFLKLLSRPHNHHQP